MGLIIGIGIGVSFDTGGGVPANALLLNGQPVLLNGQYITLTRRS
jgi:hypothetical protein